MNGRFNISTKNEDHTSAEGIEFSLVIPCLNEVETLETVITKAQSALERLGIAGEVVVSDNGSTDGSQEIARRMGAVLVDAPVRGYGGALMSGISVARGTYVIMADADDSYDWSGIDPLVEGLRQGNDLVMGCRLPKGGGTIKPGAMPWANRWIGNPSLSLIGRLLFSAPVTDFHCGMRGFRKEAIERLDLQTTGMEFASEMVLKATLAGLKIAEVPIVLHPDGRSRPPHLRRWRDGWRHLRFMLLFSPRWLFFYPGMILMTLGFMFGLRLMFGPISVGKVSFDVQTLLFAVTALIIGYQSTQFAIFSRVFSINEGLLPPNAKLAKLQSLVTLEIGLVIGMVLLLAGLAGSVYAVLYWGETSSFGPLRMNISVSLRIIIPSVGSMIIGLQTILGSFFLSVLALSRKGRAVTGTD